MKKQEGKEYYLCNFVKLFYEKKRGGEGELASLKGLSYSNIT
jgi:hypothetical protein